MGVLYILDEPSIGLHPRDNDKLIATLERLRDIGNTVIVVEHDEETMRAADHLVDFGPGPGVKGGEVVAPGDFATVSSDPNSLTGRVPVGPRDDPGPGLAEAARRPQADDRRGPPAQPRGTSTSRSRSACSSA